MPDYETMYKTLFDSVTSAIRLLQNAQIKSEDIFIETTVPEECAEAPVSGENI